jgi:hypothetical protein
MKPSATLFMTAARGLTPCYHKLFMACQRGYAIPARTRYMAAMKLPTSLLFHDVSVLLRYRAPLHDEEEAVELLMVIVRSEHKPQSLISRPSTTCIGAGPVPCRGFAEFNIKLNLLWVTIRPIPRIRYEIVGAIQEYVPDAKLVSHP